MQKTTTKRTKIADLQVCLLAEVASATVVMDTGFVVAESAVGRFLAIVKINRLTIK